MANTKSISAGRIFDGTIWLNHHAIIVVNELIEAVIPVTDLPADTKPTHHKGLLVPSFIDLQIYGAYNQLLAVEPVGVRSQLA